MDNQEIHVRISEAVRNIWKFLKDDPDPELLTDAAEMLEDLQDDLDEVIQREDEE